MPIPYFPHSGRRKHYWKLRSEGYRELMMANGWGMRGAYAEKSIKGATIMQTIVRKEATYFLCCFQRKDDFWADSTRRAGGEPRRPARPRRAAGRPLRHLRHEGGAPPALRTHCH